MKNVLLLCLSPLNSKADVNKYTFTSDDGVVCGGIKGAMTNEAPAKAMISLFNERGGGERLDRVILISSETVKKDIEPKSDIFEDEEYKFLEENPQPLSHIGLYERVIDNYAANINSDYKLNPIEYKEIPIPDFTDDEHVSAAVIEAAEQITQMDDTIHLHIDFNGGQRYIAFMLLAVANLMKIRKIDICHVLTMNFDNRDIVPIQNMSPLFNSLDLVSGINEYVKYGRIGGLKEYFKDSDNSEIKDLLSIMEEFSLNLQLYRIGYVMANKAKLRHALDNYIGKTESRDDTYSILFRYVSKDIKFGYRGLLSGDLPDIINWCVEREMVQQALTFASEELPGYFWRHNIYKATDKEKKEYNLFLDCLSAYNGESKASKYDEIDSLKKEYRKYPEDSSKYVYNWMIKYLQYSNDDYKGNKEKYKKAFMTVNFEAELAHKPPESGELEKCKRDVRKLYSFKQIRNKIPWNLKVKDAAKLLAMSSERLGRVSSNDKKRYACRNSQDVLSVEGSKKCDKPCKRQRQR